MQNPAEQMTRLRAALALGGAQSSDFDLNPTIAPSHHRLLRPAGVLAAFLQKDTGLELILTKRASHLKHHPGQVALPGGKQEDDDSDATAAALREAWEEVGLPIGQVEVLGHLPAHESISAFWMIPTVGIVHGDVSLRAEPGEVDEIFSVPFSHITNPDRFSIQARRWQGVSRRYYVAPYGPYYIWGATARILFGLARLMP